MAKVFGTDGVRGVANAELTPEDALRVARAAAAVLAHNGRGAVVVGRDTRISGTMLEAAIVAGITSAGLDVLTIGIAPTPAVAAVTHSVGGAAGIAISASHNPIEDNGIKIFGPDGYKLTDAVEERIEAALRRDDLPRPTHRDIGTAKSASDLLDLYEAQTGRAGGDLSGLTVVVDPAFGAAYRVAPRVLAQLGATVVAINDEPDGGRINVECGATDLRALAARVRDLTAAHPERHVVGVAFDGDADRALFVDETAQMLSGDHVMLALARDRKARGALPNDVLVGTVMSNAGLERALALDGISLHRTPVGDRYVLEAMRAGGYVLGGEQSGHVIDLEHSTTGDGLLTAVLLLSLIARERTTLHALVAGLRVFPQVLISVRGADKGAVERSVFIRDAIARAEHELAPAGRVLVRPSGTEPVVRVMVEGEDLALTDRVARQLASLIASTVPRDSSPPLA